MQCMEIGVKESSCSMTNATCICADIPLQANLTLCVETSCTVKEGLTTKNLMSTMCHEPIRDKSNIIVVVNSVFMALAIVATLIRSLQFHKQFGLEDMFAIVGLLSAVVMGALEFLMIDAGYGRDIWTISFANIELILKMAFLCLYLKIFPNIGLRRVIYALMGFTTLYFLIFTFGVCFNCLPVTYIWTAWTGETQGSCLDFNAFGIACAVINIVLDVVVMALPLREIIKLNLKPRKKAPVMVMFCTGFFITIVSIIRLRSVVTFANTTNATYDYVPVAYWSLIESYTAVFCMSMPAIRRFFNRILFTCCGIADSYQQESDPKCDSMALHRHTRSSNRSKDLSSRRTVKTSVSREPLARRDSDAVELVDVDYDRPLQGHG
ncbi:Nucleic acid-binding OB-fold [Penicillium riverlandense]|uniref:Nucleic acid-binding OB-fold n=1 Tax=Penicillium riverlandense TaxID=1903569 RepID=UPI002548D888|nr:Nucleic acid-binding OB-fold [Penicillium riverlandense]KAJ5818476.1 Nucleic acid-binding OB-fold [Penicillium riverlandense]